MPGSAVDVAPAAARPAGLPERRLANRPRRPRAPLFRLFYLVEIRHQQLLKLQTRTR